MEVESGEYREVGAEPHGKGQGIGLPEGGTSRGGFWMQLCSPPGGFETHGMTRCGSCKMGGNRRKALGCGVFVGGARGRPAPGALCRLSISCGWSAGEEREKVEEECRVP